MSDIVKTDAIVLSKLNYGDTSLIVSVYSEQYGKLSVIIKGGRNPKSRAGMIADTLNHINLVLYKKDTRDIQLLSSVDIVSHFPRIKEDIEKTQFALAIAELVKRLTVENEANKRLFKGLAKIFSLIDSDKEHPGVLFGRFYLFFLSELGYALQISRCGVCRNKIPAKNSGFSFETGFVCNDCFNLHSGLNFISAELLNYFFCLINNVHVKSISIDLIKQANVFLERYTKHHIPDFTGLQTLNFFSN